MDLATYELQKYEDYKALANTIGSILEAAVGVEPSLRLQQMQHRAKLPSSLRTKLKRQSLLNSKSLENDVKDLAGCRLVFYTNSDISRFLNSGIVSENFDVDWNRTKIHYPSPDSEEAQDQFISYNYVVKLKDNRTSLSEYSRFRNLWCEVQIQTILNHAWSEMAHDTIYKLPVLESFGNRLLDNIENRMREIMKKHLLPAGYEFQKVLDDYERLREGKEVLDQGALSALHDCEDNNSRYNKLQRFKEYLLPNYDNINEVYKNIYEEMIATAKKARKTPTRSIENPFGALPGHSVQQIIELVADVIDYLRYVDVKTTFDIICELFSGARSDEERNRLLQSAEKLAKHDRDVWIEAGPIVQSDLVEHILPLDDRFYAPFEPVLLRVLTEILKPTVEGFSSTYRSVTIHQGAVQTSEVLKRTRDDAIECLKSLYHNAETDDRRRAIIKALATATTTPHMGDYSNDLFVTVLEDATKIIEFYTNVSNDQSYEILQELEHDLLWLHRRNKKLPYDIAGDPNIIQAKENLNNAIIKFRDNINKDNNFIVYKLLVGFESVFRPDWEADGHGIEEEKRYREQQINKLIDQVNDDSAEAWLKTLKRCARTKSNDGATFLSLHEFLRGLGETKPKITFGFLDYLDENLANFLPIILHGLSKSLLARETRLRVELWIEEKRYLPQLARYLRMADRFDIDLISRMLKIAIDENDEYIVLEVFLTAISRYNEHKINLIDSIFIPAIKFFTIKKSVRWVDEGWFYWKGDSILNDLNVDQINLLLKNMISVRKIDYHAEEVLYFIAKIEPELVVNFFGNRIRHERTLESTEDHLFSNNRYESVPHSFHKLHKPLSNLAEYVVDSARGWFDEADGLFLFRGGRLPAIIFPKFQVNFEKKLTSLARSGVKADIEFLISVFRNYEGQVFLHNICKDIVDSLPPDDELTKEVDIVLDETDVVCGEFGFVNSFKQKQTEIEPWLSDGRDKVKSFAQRRIHSLEQQIAAEQRRSEERLERRKREYDDQFLHIDTPGHRLSGFRCPTAMPV